MSGTDPTRIAPTKDDELIGESSELVGGPLSKRVAYTGLSTAATSWWNPIRVLIAIGAVTFIVGIIQKIPCISTGWSSPGRYLTMCYSDIPPLYSMRGFSSGVFPYISQPLPGQEQLEYPVLTGLFMTVANWLTPVLGQGGTGFFAANVILLAGCFFAAIVATAKTVRSRPWDAALLAAAPGVALCATINWDLLAIALSAIAMLLWARKYPVAAGVFFGLAAAAKFYPFLFFGPLLLLCWRAGRMRAFWQSLGGAIAAWLVINLPFMLINFEGWYHFYGFSSTRGEDFGSFWLVLSTVGLKIPADALNLIAMAAFLLLCAAIAALTITAKRRPRFAQIAFLVVAAFLLTNKVYSPQFVMWLIPLAALALPRWRPFFVWQACEVIYYGAIWLYLAQMDGARGLPAGWYAIAILVHIAGTCYFAGLIIRDILNPALDPIRSDADPANDDDPGGGVLDGAPDRALLARRFKF